MRILDIFKRQDKEESNDGTVRSKMGGKERFLSAKDKERLSKTHKAKVVLFIAEKEDTTSSKNILRSRVAKLNKVIRDLIDVHGEIHKDIVKALKEDGYGDSDLLYDLSITGDKVGRYRGEYVTRMIRTAGYCGLMLPVKRVSRSKAIGGMRVDSSGSVISMGEPREIIRAKKLKTHLERIISGEVLVRPESKK